MVDELLKYQLLLGFLIRNELVFSLCKELHDVRFGNWRLFELSFMNKTSVK